MASPDNPNEGQVPPPKPVPVVPKPPTAGVAHADPAAAPPKPAAVAVERRRDRRPSLLAGLLRNTPAWAISMLVHVIVLLAMALIVTEPPKPEKPRLITASAPEVEDSFEEFEEPEMSDPVVPDQPLSEFFTSPDDAPMQDVEVVTDANDLDASQSSIEITDLSSNLAAGTDMLAAVGVRGGTATGFGGRTSSATRSDMLRSGLGGLAEKFEKQIREDTEMAIDWIWTHQMEDGGWTFDCASNPFCKGQCEMPKIKSNLKDRVGATALALWPVVMQGYTHNGPINAKLSQPEKERLKLIQDKLRLGLGFLATNVQQGNGKAFHRGGNMYSQALTTAVLVEAFAQSQDSDLQRPAQMAVDFIMKAQDPNGGGWRYTPGQPGDTSSVAWQLGALKSAGLTPGMRVYPQVIKKAVMFLDSVQSDGGAAYGYIDASSARPSLNGAGLLSRLFTGWKANNETVLAGARKLAKIGPTNDMYATYYATQVLFYVRKSLPKEWEAWQLAMIPKVKAAQATDSHKKGSYFTGYDKGHAPEVGGRLYITSMATMTLEVYFGKGAMVKDAEMVLVDDFQE